MASMSGVALSIYGSDRHVLQLRLQGPAREALRSLSPETKSQLSTLLAALRDRFLPANHHEVKRSTFRLRTQRSDKGILAFGNAIRGLAAQAFPTMDIAQRDLLSRDQFLDGLRDSIRRLRVRYGNPKSLDDAIRIALEVNAADYPKNVAALTTDNRPALQRCHLHLSPRPHLQTPCRKQSNNNLRYSPLFSTALFAWSHRLTLRSLCRLAFRTHHVRLCLWRSAAVGIVVNWDTFA